MRSRLESALTGQIKCAKLISTSTNINERLAVRFIHLRGFVELVHCYDALSVRLASRVLWGFSHNIVIGLLYNGQIGYRVLFIHMFILCNTLKRTSVVQITLVIRAFAIRFFAYPRFYFRIMRSINILSAVKF
jgi:hypothetical protein